MITRKIHLLIITLGTVTFLAGCSTVQTTVIPKSHGKYQVIATAENSANAQKGAIDKASKVCQQQGKKLVVEKNQTIYQGSGKELGNISQALSTAAAMNTNTFVPTTKSNTDYKTVTTFKCA